MIKIENALSNLYASIDSWGSGDDYLDFDFSSDPLTFELMDEIEFFSLDQSEGEVDED